MANEPSVFPHAFGGGSESHVLQSSRKGARCTLVLRAKPVARSPHVRGALPFKNPFDVFAWDKTRASRTSLLSGSATPPKHLRLQQQMQKTSSSHTHRPFLTPKVAGHERKTQSEQFNVKSLHPATKGLKHGKDHATSFGFTQTMLRKKKCNQRDNTPQQTRTKHLRKRPQKVKKDGAEKRLTCERREHAKQKLVKPAWPERT